MKRTRWTKAVLGALVALLTLSLAGSVALAAGRAQEGDASGSEGILPPGQGRPRAWGKVTKVHGKTLEVENRRGTFEVLTDDETLFRIPGVEEPSIKDVEVGDVVAGKVVQQEDGTLLATAIAVLPPPRPGERRGIGRVMAIQGQTLEVETRWCTAEIRTDGEIVFRVPGVEEPTIEDIEVGDLIAGKVVRQEDDTLLAKAIAVLPPRGEEPRPSSESAP
jgi:exosome complex RNA-binding protein Csl4